MRRINQYVTIIVVVLSLMTGTVNATNLSWVHGPMEEEGKVPSLAIGTAKATDWRLGP